MNKNQQVRLLAIGVSDYRRTEFTSLPSASNDSRELYGTFAKVLGSVLDSAHSVHAVNITADLFLSLLTYVLEQEMQDDALLVLYFSGHATIEQQVLTLHFVDSRDNRWGVVTTQEIDEILRRFNRPETVLILDCCYSGLAGSLAKSSNPFFPAKTTIISSSRPYEVSSYDSDHSIFTKALVNSLHFLDQSGERISVTKLHEQIEHLLQGKAEQNPAVFVREGRADVVLKSPDAGTKEEKKRFHIAFVQALLISNPSDRETLWYSLNEYPEHVILEVIHRSIDVELHEPLWLIRRAMGSTLSSVTRLLTQKKHLYLKLMGSTQWMDVCVGAIGARFDVTDDATCEALQDVSTSSMPMDAKWLAFLYLADRFHIGLLDRMDFLATDLTESKWGVCEI